MQAAKAGDQKNTIYVGGFGPDIDSQSLYSTFTTFGEVLDVQIPPDPQKRDGTGHRGFGFVTFSQNTDALDAIDNMHLSEINGKILKVNIAKPMRGQLNAGTNRATHAPWSDTAGRMSDPHASTVFPQRSSSQDPADLLLANYPETAKLSRDDIEELLRSPAYFDAFFGTLTQSSLLYKEHEELLSINEQVTAKNVALKERHEQLKQETEAAFREARSLQERWHSHTLPLQNEAYKRLAHPVQLSRLRHALGDQDRLSESLITSLLEGSITPDDFARQFKEVRRVYYRRGTQADKWLGGQVDWREA
ncbi:MAG: hypothetical protein CYPHOPRED_003558 [Cyphobasidiales sp. Tagirdzhanova-0007]|nr:MAG: hypothetical protein CYPHOPRED_003558 [Cyphobasidiales sp. Tagirdzhanova-0007]